MTQQVQRTATTKTCQSWRHEQQQQQGVADGGVPVAAAFARERQRLLLQGHQQAFQSLGVSGAAQHVAAVLSCVAAMCSSMQLVLLGCPLARFRSKMNPSSLGLALSSQLGLCQQSHRECFWSVLGVCVESVCVVVFQQDSANSDPRAIAVTHHNSSRLSYVRDTASALHKPPSRHTATMLSPA